MEDCDVSYPLKEDMNWQFTSKCDLQTLEITLKRVGIPSADSSIQDLRLKLFHGMLTGLIDSEQTSNSDAKQTTSSGPSACRCRWSPHRRQKFMVGQYVNLDHPLQLDGWHGNIVHFPIMSTQQISLYFKKRKAQLGLPGTHEVKTLAAARRMSVTSGCIRNVEHHSISDTINVCYVRGLVIPGPHSQHRPYLVWARIVKSSGAIQEAECTCQLGSNSGACLHILALLFHIANQTSPRSKKTEEQAVGHKEVQHTSHNNSHSQDVSEDSSDSFSECDMDDLPDASEKTENTLKYEIPQTNALGHHLLFHQQEPVVFSNAISGWPAASWTPLSLSQLLNDKPLTFRIGTKYSKGVQWETDCGYELATIGEFVRWTAGGSACGALSKYQPTTSWCYWDYKHMAHEFSHLPQLLQAVDWSPLGFPGRGAEKSTFWLGSAGAHTQCHYDTYGCNLVAQIYGRKRWVLFPPSDMCRMYPTRIPYEESSVFSNVNVANPDVQQNPKFKDVSPIIVTLEPGDVLYVPRHWWHDVTSLTTSISINTWLELPHDNEERVREAITRTLVMAIMQDSDAQWLNPTEQLSSFKENLNCLQAAIQLSSQPSETEKDVPMERWKHLDTTRTTESESDTDHCSCSPSFPIVDLTQRIKQLSVCTFTQLQALMATEQQLDSPPGDKDLEGVTIKDSLDVRLTEAVSHPDVIQSIQELICP